MSTNGQFLIRVRAMSPKCVFSALPVFTWLITWRCLLVRWLVRWSLLLVSRLVFLKAINRNIEVSLWEPPVLKRSFIWCHHQLFCKCFYMLLLSVIKTNKYKILWMCWVAQKESNLTTIHVTYDKVNLLTFLGFDPLSPSSETLGETIQCLRGTVFPDKICLSVGLRENRLLEVALSSVFWSVSIKMGPLPRRLTETVLSMVISSDLCIASLPDILLSGWPFIDVVAESDETSGGENGLRTCNERAAWSLLAASISWEEIANSRCKIPDQQKGQASMCFVSMIERFWVYTLV